MKRKQMMALTLAVMMGTLTACSSGEKEPETAPAKTDGSGVSEEAGKAGAQAGESVLQLQSMRKWQLMDSM